MTKLECILKSVDANELDILGGQVSTDVLLALVLRLKQKKVISGIKKYNLCKQLSKNTITYHKLIETLYLETTMYLYVQVLQYPVFRVYYSRVNDIYILVMYPKESGFSYAKYLIV